MTCRIMRILRSGAGPDTKLIIGDMLLPNACEAQDTFVQDGSPLLPNLGVANIHGFLMDLTVSGTVSDPTTIRNSLTARLRR